MCSGLCLDTDRGARRGHPPGPGELARRRRRPPPDAAVSAVPAGSRLDETAGYLGGLARGLSTPSPAGTPARLKGPPAGAPGGPPRHLARASDMVGLDCRHPGYSHRHRVSIQPALASAGRRTAATASSPPVQRWLRTSPPWAPGLVVSAPEILGGARRLLQQVRGRKAVRLARFITAARYAPASPAVGLLPLAAGTRHPVGRTTGGHLKANRAPTVRLRDRTLSIHVDPSADGGRGEGSATSCRTISRPRLVNSWTTSPVALIAVWTPGRW